MSLQKIIMESISTKNTKIYFLSDKKGLTRLSPRIPDNFFTKNGYEDSHTKRVCFSTSIGKCLTALPKKYEGKEFYVYIPDPNKEYRIITPTIKQVPDCKITNEKWICEPVNIVCIGKIQCIGAEGEGLPYKYGNNKTAELYNWAWEWLEKY